MKRYETYLLISEDGDPPSQNDVSQAINEKSREGWRFVQMATGGYATVALDGARFGGKASRSESDGRYEKEYQLDFDMVSTETDYDYTAWVYLIFERDESDEPSR